MAVSAPGNQLIDLSELPPEMAMMRLENDNIQAMATARPRDYEEIKKNVIAQIKAFPAFAAKIIYCKPVGKDEDGVMQFARNLSVRAAECLAEAYGYNRVASTITPIDDDHAGVEATFVDYQRGRIWQDRRVISRAYKGRGGITKRHPEDRFYGIVCAAEASRRIREVILRSVPPGLKQELFEAAEKEMKKLLTEEEMKRIVTAFASKGVSLDKLEAYLGRTQKSGWTSSDRQRLAETWSAIENEEATVADFFGQPGDQSAATAGGAAGSPENGRGKQPAAAASGEVTADDLANPKGRAEQPLEETPPANPKGQVGPHKPPQEPAEETTLEREPRDDNDDAAGYEPQAEGVEELPDWAQSLYDELQAEGLGIREIKALAKRYADAPERTNTDRDWIKSVSDQACEIIRNSRGGKSNSPQQREFEQN